MAGDEVGGWDPFLYSVLHLAEQIEELGVVYIGGQAVSVRSNSET